MGGAGGQPPRAAGQSALAIPVANVQPPRSSIMLIARWQIDARFGHKQEVIERLQAWAREIAPQAGLVTGRLLTGSIGALEATVVPDWEVSNLGELDSAWARLASIPAHAQW